MATDTKQTITVAQYEALMVPPPECLTSTQLFDYPAQCYADAGIATPEELEPLRVCTPEDGKPFLVVPPKPQIADKGMLDALITNLTYGGKRGVNYINPQHLVDEVAVPKNAYLAVNVDDGRAMLNVTSRDARIRLAEAHRSPFTWWENYCLYLCFGFALFAHHNGNCSGSRCWSEFVPDFFLGYGEPRFNYWGGHAVPEWGSASCGSRIGL